MILQRGIQSFLIITKNLPLCIWHKTAADIMNRTSWRIFADLNQRVHLPSFFSSGTDFPTIEAIKKTTTTTMPFCSIECTDTPACYSFAYLTTSDTENCHLGPTQDGLATATRAVVYKKRTWRAIEVWDKYNIISKF